MPNTMSTPHWHRLCHNALMIGFILFAFASFLVPLLQEHQPIAYCQGHGGPLSTDIARGVVICKDHTTVLYSGTTAYGEPTGSARRTMLLVLRITADVGAIVGVLAFVGSLLPKRWITQQQPTDPTN